MKNFILFCMCLFSPSLCLATTIGSPLVCTAPAVYTLGAATYGADTMIVLGTSPDWTIAGCGADILYNGNVKRTENPLQVLWDGSQPACVGNYKFETETCVTPACGPITNPYYWEGNYCRGRSYDNLPACTISDNFVDASFCSSQTPPACVNGTKDSFEDGIDCGGLCSDVTCKQLCPEGYEIAGAGGDDITGNGLIDKCVQRAPMNSDGSCPTGYSMSPQYHSYSTAALFPVCVNEIPITPGADGITIDQPPGPEPPGPDDPEQSSTLCTDKTFSDGTICTTCTDSAGKQSITCIGPNGTISSTQTPVTTETPEGCKETTYSNGTKCTVCRDASGNPVVTCVDTNGAPTAADGEAVNAAGDALLRSIEKKMAGVESGVAGVGSGVGQVATGIKEGNLLQREGNELLRQINAKDPNVTVNVDTQPIVTELEEANTGIAGILDRLKLSTPEEVAATEADITSKIDAFFSAKTEAHDSSVQGVMDDFDPSYFAPLEGLKDKVKGVLPAPGACEALVINWTSTQQTIFPCEPFLKFKELFGYVLYAWTTLQVVGLLFSAKFYGQA